jgi:hypothetical protein
MLDSLARTLEILITQFTLRRFLALVFLAGFIPLSIVAFDWYTGYLSLGRLERQVDLLERLTAHATPSETNGNAALVEVYERIVEDLRTVSQPRVGLNLDLTWSARLFGGGLLWFLFSLAFLPDAKKDPSKVSSVVGSVCLGVVFGLLAQLLPDSWATASGIAIYSVGNFFAIAMLALVMQSRKTARVQSK